MDGIFKTPMLGNQDPADFDAVYEPAEDSFLLLDMLEKDHANLMAINPCICLEVGSGSGICITFLAQIVGRSVTYFCTDINLKAVEMTKATAHKNGRSVEPVLCNLADALEHRLEGKVDVLLFNPPYVVTPSDEVACDGIEASWAGGIKGREVTDKFLPKVASLLSPEGAFYLVVIKENDPDDIEELMKGYGFRMKCVGSRRAGREFLSILRFTRQSSRVDTPL
ncbi:N(6)-adenine-specific DNA methyltransferase 1 [Elysia marginata]|uniref:Methyltransferase HEMK2 n=1 Tax=Elysia marginata TaxID=1093978 RepID=A0AAV4FNZ7_9GAST|nr:N(6)-adenine-specific DNA methyltransferase 1 [Elysia marginata]